MMSLVIILGIQGSPVAAQDASQNSEVAMQQTEISIQEAIQLALENNFDIRIEQYNPEIATEDIRAAEAAFDPTLSSDGLYTRNDSSSSTEANNTGSFDIGFGQTFAAGTGYNLTLQTDVSDLGGEYADNANSTSLSLTISQPLLKGRGSEVNTIAISSSQKQRDISISELRSVVSQVVADVQDAYWELVQARGVLEADRYSLQLAYDQVNINEAQVKVGTLAPIEILQAQSTAASREVQVISDEQDVRNTEDNLRQLLGIAEDDPLWSAELIPMDSPELTQQTPSLEQSIQRALSNREDLKQLQLSLDIQDLSLKKAENDLLPDLSLQVGASLSGEDNSWGGSMGNLAEFDTHALNVRLAFTYPLGNAAAKSEYHQTQLERDQARLSLLNFEQQIVAEVKQAVRSVETSYKQIEATKIAQQLAEKQLEAEQKKFNEGLSTNFQVLEYQDELASAQSESTKAVVSYYKALVALDEAMGMTLQQHDITVKE